MFGILCSVGRQVGAFDWQSDPYPFELQGHGREHRPGDGSARAASCQRLRLLTFVGHGGPFAVAVPGEFED